MCCNLFINCWLGLFIKQQESTTTVEQLEERIWDKPGGLVPEWTRFITAGVDTQDDEFVVTFAVAPLPLDTTDNNSFEYKS